MIQIKRVYEPAQKEDGFRILIDRLWPRRISKKEAKIDEWLKDIAPSDTLRKWFAHDQSKWKEFKKKYTDELKQNKEAITRLKELIKTNKTVTLLYAAKDELHNNAVVLLGYIK